MGQTIQSKEFRWMTKGLRTAFTIIMVMMIFALTMLAIFMVGAMVVSEQQVNHLLTKGSVIATVQLEGFEMNLADHVTRDIHYSKKDVMTFLFIATIYIAILLMIIVQVRNILSNLSKGIVFSLANSKKMERIAYCVIVLSLTVNAFRTYTVYLIMQQFQLESRFVETGLIKGISYHFTGIHWTLLLCGVVIWIFARIFRYGAFLQDEYDATA